MTKVGLAVHRTFHSLQTRNFRLFFIGQVVSVTGTWLNATATAWLVLRLTGSGVSLGVNTALTFLPILLLGPVGGAMADRLDKRRILIATQSAAAVISLALFALVATDATRLWMVYALSLAAGFVTAIDNPTRQSFYMEMVTERDLTNAVSLNSAAFTGARMVGPALAGILIATVGIWSCFLLDGVSYLAVIGALVAMRPDEMHLRDLGEDAASGIREGFRYVWRTPELRIPIMLMAVFYTFAFNFSVWVPLLAKQTFHGTAETFGILSALAGAGSFVGAITMANRTGARGPIATVRRLAIFAIVSGVALIAIGSVRSLDAAYLVMVPVGTATMLFAINANSLLQLRSLPEFRGRVMALYGMVFLGSTPFGALLAGWVSERYGAGAGFALGGVAAIVVGATGLWLQSRARGGTGVPAADAGAIDAEVLPA